MSYNSKKYLGICKKQIINCFWENDFWKVKLIPEHFKMEFLSGGSVVHKDRQSILTLSWNYFPNWILNWMIILTLQLDWRNKYIQQTWANFWAPWVCAVISMPGFLTIFERIFWKMGTTLAQGCFCKKIWNTILFYLFLLTKLTALYKGVLYPHFAHEQTPGRSTGQINFPSGTPGQSQQYKFGPSKPRLVPTRHLPGR